MSEVNYLYVQKMGHSSVTIGPYSDQGYHMHPQETKSYRSASPPILDKQTGMMSRLNQSSQQALQSRNGQPSPGLSGDMPFPSPGYGGDLSNWGLMYASHFDIFTFFKLV